MTGGYRLVVPAPIYKNLGFLKALEVTQGKM